MSAAFDMEAFKRLSRAALQAADDLDLHREAVSVPLEFEGEGAVRLVDGVRIVVTGPARGDLDAFLAALKPRMAALDLTAVPRAPEF